MTDAGDAQGRILRFPRRRRTGPFFVLLALAVSFAIGLVVSHVTA